MVRMSEGKYVSERQTDVAFKQRGQLAKCFQHLSRKVHCEEKCWLLKLKKNISTDDIGSDLYSYLYAL